MNRNNRIVASAALTFLLVVPATMANAGASRTERELRPGECLVITWWPSEHPVRLKTTCRGTERVVVPAGAGVIVKHWNGRAVALEDGRTVRGRWRPQGALAGCYGDVDMPGGRPHAH